MKRVLQLSVLLLLYIVFSAKSCSDEEEFNAAREQKAAESTRDSIMTVFGSEKPSAGSLGAFEETAIQRFNDFLDYANITTDTSKAPEFREQAGKMLRELFVSGSNAILLAPVNGTVKIISSVSCFSGQEKIPEGIITLSRPDSVWVDSGLRVFNDSMYEGRLGFSLATALPENSPVKYRLAGGTMDFFLIKRSRVFGTDTLKVWTIALGDIR
jgi:hypothetical protein